MLAACQSSAYFPFLPLECIVTHTFQLLLNLLHTALVVALCLSSKSV